MAALADTTVLTYNNVTFSSFTASRFNAEVVYEDSNRTVRFLRFTLNARCHFSGDDLDETMDELYKRLSRPGKRLIIRDKGIGNFDVNGPGKVRDVAWGPHPKVVALTPLGGGRGAILDYQIVFQIPQCPDTVRYEGIIALVYEIAWDIDILGYTSRVVSGHLEIGMTRRGVGVDVGRSADDYYEKVIPQLPPSFKREQQSRKLSSDRRTLTFSFKDVELPTPYPENVGEIEVEQTISGKFYEPGGKGGSFKVWNFQFSGSASVVAGRSQNDALNAIMQTIGRRLLFIQNGVRAAQLGARIDEIKKALGEVVINPKESMTLIPTSFRVTEQLFGKTLRVDLGYILIGSSIHTIIKDSGLFLPVANSGRKWHDETYLKFIDGRGHARMEFEPFDEVLIDLCTAKDEPTTSTMTTAKPKEFNARPLEKHEVKTVVDPEASWVSYQNHLRVVTQNRIAKHKRIPVTDPEQLDPKQKGNDAGSDRAIDLKREIRTELPGKLPPAEARDVIQKLGAPSYRVMMTGMGVRLQHRVPAPRLLKVGGRDAVQVDADIESFTLARIGNVPMNATTWSILYEVDGKPQGELPSLANPQYDSDGGTRNV